MGEAAEPSPQTVEQIFDAVKAALPALPTPRVVDMLEFMYAQHSGSSFNPDNTSKAAAIIEFLEARPFPATGEGVTSLAALARHALSRSEGQANSPEHQLWLLTSSALNTAAAIAAFEGDAARLFDAIDRGGPERGKYLQRHYATLAMRQHAEDAPQAAPAARRRYLVPENLPVAAVYATLGMLVLGWLVMEYILPKPPV
jgi:hypothetical protein